MALHTRLSLVCLTGALLVLTTALAAPPAATVSYAPAVQQQLQDRYGAAEGDLLRADIRAAISRQLGKLALPPGTAVSVTVTDLAPTRPTRRQQSDDPTLDPVLTQYLGGAELHGVVRDAAGQALRTVQYRYFAPDLRAGSVARDPWADARLAVEGFAARLAAACKTLAAAPRA
jgi:hypothetical protein